MSQEHVQLTQKTATKLLQALVTLVLVSQAECLCQKRRHKVLVKIDILISRKCNLILAYKFSTLAIVLLNKITK